ncbi:MAG: hypothetical protein ABIK65_09715 [Candidatus Eisenbacteria bacterium]
MHRLIAGLLILGLASGAFAFDLGTHRTEIKTDAHVQPNRGVSDGREGGETCASAYVITSLPFNDTGATCDNSNDYDAVCPYSGSTSPDVVYSWTANFTGTLDIDLCGSFYDTKVYVYENACGSLYACNDDYYFDATCGTYVSAIFGMPVTSGNTYYIVIDGYGGDCGEYLLAVTGHEDCTLECAGAPEGEPTLVNYYTDAYNGGCNSLPPVFQTLWGDAQGCLNFCGVSGWYYYDADFRDTDWFIVTAMGTSIDWTVDAEQPVYMFLLSPQDCANVAVEMSEVAGPCAPGNMNFPTTPGAVYWLWVGPQTFTGPAQPFEFDYVMDICGIEPGVTSTKETSWGTIKKMYR